MLCFLCTQLQYIIFIHSGRLTDGLMVDSFRQKQKLIEDLIVITERRVFTFSFILLLNYVLKDEAYIIPVLPID